MPNFCYNRLFISHKDPAMITRAVDAFKRGEFLQEFIPCPKELYDKDANWLQNMDKYGYTDWYEHHIDLWGTKWDVGEEDGIDALNEDNAELVFDSAWSPPIAAYGTLEEMGFSIQAYYYEPGIGFCGKYEDGEDYEYQLKHFDSIPEDIIEECGIEEYGDEDE